MSSRALVLGSLALLSCAPRATVVQSAQIPESPRTPVPAMADWKRGLPPLDRVRSADFKPAIEWAIAEKRRELSRIAGLAEPPTFENTIVAIERAGLPLADVEGLFDWWSRSFRDDAFDAVENELEPRITAFDTEQFQDPVLARRVEAVWRASGDANLSAEQKQLTEHTLLQFKHAGAFLSETARARLRKIDERTGELYAAFSQNVSAEGTATQVVLTQESELAGLPDSFREEAASAAKAQGHPGAWAVRNRYNDVQAFLAHSTRRDLREKVWRANRSRAERGGEHDNTALVKELVALRNERARLLGYASYAKLKTEDAMMRSPERAAAWLSELAVPVARKAQREIAELQQEADREQDQRKQPRFRLEPWDLRFYEEQIRREKFGVDEAEVSAYLDSESMREAMFWVASQLFGLKFTAVPDAPVPSPDLRVWAVTRGEGQRLGYLYFDPYPRAGKGSGAWTVTYRDQQHLVADRMTVVAISYSFPRPQAGGRNAISWDDAVGLFHEFGHSLQALLSDVTYPSLAGLNVPRDSIEMASQWLERYVATPEVLGRFTHHLRTNAPLPASLAARIAASKNLGEGLRTEAMLLSAVADLRLHSGADAPSGFTALEAQIREELHAPAETFPISRPSQAIYLFGGDNYSAQFYSYLWSDALAAEAFEAFSEGKGPYDAAVAERLRAQILSRGASVDAEAAFRAFRGSAPGIDAFVRKRGLAL